MANLTPALVRAPSPSQLRRISPSSTATRISLIDLLSVGWEISPWMKRLAIATPSTRTRPNQAWFSSSRRGCQIFLKDVGMKNSFYGSRSLRDSQYKSKRKA